MPRYRVGPLTQAECTRCGACCVNPPANAAEGFARYVELAPRDLILRRPDLVRRLVVLDEDGGGGHLRLDPAGRCLALRGRVGARVTCTIYAERPAACRKVQPGSGECERARAALGLD